MLTVKAEYHGIMRSNLQHTSDDRQIRDRLSKERLRHLTRRIYGMLRNAVLESRVVAL